MLRLFLILTIATCAKSIILTRCELVQQLKQNGFSDTLMPSWVCVVEAESKRNTALKTPQSDGTTKWGLFQLANPKWCSPGIAGGTCKVKCEDLLLDNISKSASCASTVYKSEGFKAWPGWLESCQGTLPDVNNCSSTSSRTARFLESLRKNQIG